MTTKITYIADDGEEFETEEECLEYEKRCDPEDSIVMIDYTHNQEYRIVQCHDPMLRFENSEIYFIRNAKKAKEFFQWVQDQNGYEIPSDIKDGGIYIYNDHGYDHLQAELDRLAIMKAKVLEAVYGSAEA